MRDGAGPLGYRTGVLAVLHNVRGWVMVFHLIGVVFWVGGLLVLARVLRFHADEPPSVRPVLSRLEGWLQYFFILPGALLVLGCGAWLTRNQGLAWLRVSLWMHAKLVLIALLCFVHLALWSAQRRVKKTDPQRGVVRGGWKLQQLALWVLLVAISMLSVLRPFVSGPTP